jgi:hypothetical protein
LQQHGWQMRAIGIIIALIVALAFVADIYWYGGSYTRLVFHSLGAGFMILVNNW